MSAPLVLFAAAEHMRVSLVNNRLVITIFDKHPDA